MMRRKARRKEAAFLAGELADAELAQSVRGSMAYVEHAATRRLRRRFVGDSVDA